MATRMQQRRGTAAQWVSTNDGDGPILEVGEIGFETDTGKFKIGDGTNRWADLDYFLDESEIDSITGDYVLSSTVGAAGGVATLDGSGELTSSQIPTSLATTSYVDDAVSNLVDSAPGALDTLNELAAALGDDANFASTITTSLGNKQDIVSGVSDTEIGYLANVTSDIQTQLDNKLASADLNEAAQDAVNTALVAGTGLDKTYNDNANTITLDIDATVTTNDGTQTLTNKTINAGNNTISNIPNASLDNSSITINGESVELGGTATIPTGFTSQAVSSNISLEKNYNYFVDTSAARTLTLPASPTAGDEIHIFDATGSAATNKITVGSNGGKINGTVQDLEIDVNNAAVVIIYTGTSYGWRVG